MKVIKRSRLVKDIQTWEEKSGFLDFLSRVPEEVERFNRNFEFGIKNIVTPPAMINGDEGMPLKAGFVLVRDNPLVPEVTYCLYSLLLNRELFGYTGVLKNGSITTLKQLKPVKDFQKGNLILHEWLTQLVRASCEKKMP